MNFFHKIHNSIIKTKQWPPSKWLTALSWVVTGIMLLVLIILLVSYASSLGETFPDTDVLTETAIIQQNTIAAIAFVFFLSLTVAIFAMVINIYRKNKMKKGRA